jgi:hypothetical protein
VNSRKELGCAGQGEGCRGFSIGTVFADFTQNLDVELKGDFGLVDDAAALAARTLIFGFSRITGAIRDGFSAQEQTDRLFTMTDMLQSAAGQG